MTPNCANVQCPLAYVRNSIKSSQADSYIRLFKTVTVLETDSVCITIMIETESVSEILTV